MVCCDCEYALRLAAPTCEDGGGVNEDGITVASGLSSLSSVLNDAFGSTGDPGPSVEGRVTCDIVGEGCHGGC